MYIIKNTIKNPAKKFLDINEYETLAENLKQYYRRITQEDIDLIAQNYELCNDEEDIV